MYNETFYKTLKDLPEWHEVYRFIVKAKVEDSDECPEVSRLTSWVYKENLDIQKKHMKAAWILSLASYDIWQPQNPTYFLNDENIKATVATVKQAPKIIDEFDSDFILEVKELTLEEKMNLL